MAHSELLQVALNDFNMEHSKDLIGLVFSKREALPPYVAFVDLEPRTLTAEVTHGPMGDNILEIYFDGILIYILTEELIEFVEAAHFKVDSDEGIKKALCFLRVMSEEETLIVHN